MKSCNNCIKSRVCKYKPSPPSGSCSGGMEILIGHLEFANKVFELYGSCCKDYVFDNAYI